MSQFPIAENPLTGLVLPMPNDSLNPRYYVEDNSEFLPELSSYNHEGVNFLTKSVWDRFKTQSDRINALENRLERLHRKVIGLVQDCPSS